jgi:hypothetical protein
VATIRVPFGGLHGGRWLVSAVRRLHPKAAVGPTVVVGDVVVEDAFGVLRVLDDHAVESSRGGACHVLAW